MKFFNVRILEIKHFSGKNGILTYLLTPWRRVLLEKLTGSAASQEIPRILWNPKVHGKNDMTLLNTTSGR